VFTKEIDLTGKNVGNYKIINQLGRGGMAVVYKAHESSLNRIVALKVLSSRLSEDTEYIKRFQREARAAAQLNHPNIVQIYAIGEEEGIHYFAMEYIKGESLSDVKRKTGKMAPKKAIPLIKQVAEALGEAHKAGLVHRDIKPSNIMINAMGRAKVTDFGIAYVSREQTRLTQEGSIIGTPEYLSPEQCEGRNIDGRSDIYSLGVTFYELLTGKTPYEADTPVSMLMQIVKGNFPPIAEVNPDVPESVQRVVEKMMHTDTNSRYADVNEVIAALEEIENKERRGKNKIAVEPAAGAVEYAEGQKGKNRNKLMALTIIAVIVLLMGGAFAAKALYFDKQDVKDTAQVKTLSQLPVDSVSNEGETPNKKVQETTDNRDNQNVTPMTSSSSTVLTGAAHKDSSDNAFSGEPETREFSASGQPAGQSLQKRKPPVIKLPPANSIVLTTLGDEDKGDFITAHVQSILKNNDFMVVDGPSVDMSDLPGVARYHLVTTVKHMGTTELNYYGSTSELYTVGITIKIISSRNGRIAAGPVSSTVKYTAINAEEKLREVIESLTLEIKNELKNSTH
jgi:serine/threonine protein kinase